jgi:hypothetical protein
MSSNALLDQVASLVAAAFHVGQLLASKSTAAKAIVDGLEHAQSTAGHMKAQSVESRDLLQQYILDVHQVLANFDSIDEKADDVPGEAPAASSNDTSTQAHASAALTSESAEFKETWERVHASVPAYLLPDESSVEMLKQLTIQPVFGASPDGSGVPSIRRQFEASQSLDELVEPYLLSDNMRQSFAHMHPTDRVAVMKMLS